MHECVYTHACVEECIISKSANSIECEENIRNRPAECRKNNENRGALCGVLCINYSSEISTEEYSDNSRS